MKTSVFFSNILTHLHSPTGLPGIHPLNPLPAFNPQNRWNSTQKPTRKQINQRHPSGPFGVTMVAEKGITKRISVS